MRIRSCLVVALGWAGVAHADEFDHQPPQHWVSSVEAEWLPLGGMLYSGNYGRGDIDVDTAWGLAGSVGYEIDGGFELGFGARFIANEKWSDADFRASELIVGPKLTMHTHTAGAYDVQFTIAPQYSHVFFPADAGWPDPSGLTVDFAVTVGFPLRDRLWLITSLGYQRGFQHTTEMPLMPPLPGQDPGPLDTNFATDYGHLGAGVAYRF